MQKQQRRGRATAATPPPNRSLASLSTHLSKLIIPAAAPPPTFLFEPPLGRRSREAR